MEPRGLNLGRFLGVRIRLDWSLLVIFLLVLFSLASGVLPSWHDNWSSALIWAVAVAAAVLFFASVLLHELAHALVAKAFGVPVRSITLFLFGGMANIEQEPKSPKAEALMAMVGPLVSIGLGFGLSLAASVLMGGRVEDVTDVETLARQMSPLETLFAWLGPINILLGVFNLLPGFPLDGGRVLRAGLWAATRDLERATRWAAGAGQALAWFLIIAGIAMTFGFWVPFFGTGFAPGLWLAFIGWFLNMAAAASYRQLLMRGLLEDVPVIRLARRSVPTVDADASLSTLVDDYIMPAGERAVPVVSEHRVIGLVKTSDVRKVGRDAWLTARVGEVMEPLASAATAAPNDDAYETLTEMSRRGVDEVLVLDEHGKLRGLLRREDIVRWLELQAQGSERHSAPHWHQRSNP